MIETLAPPAPSGVLREALCLIELPRLLLRMPFLVTQPRGKNEPVLILPPHGTGDGSTALLRAYLRILGYRARGWGLGANRGNVTDLLPRALKRLASFAKRSNQKVTLIGWSFGGYLARELARERPDLVRRVITLGTPVIGGPKYTAIAEIYRKRGMDIEAIASEVELRNQSALLEMAVTAIYSRHDGIVAWEACIDRQTPNVEHVEVRSTHFGFGFSPDVYKIIAHALAQTSDKQTTIGAPMAKHEHGRRLPRVEGAKTRAKDNKSE